MGEIEISFEEDTVTNASAPTPLTDDELRQVKERAEAATAGPWVCDDHGDLGGDFSIEAPAATPYGECIAWFDSEDGADGEFIAHAREDIPALLATVDAYRERLGTAMAAIRLARDAVFEMEGKSRVRSRDVDNFPASYEITVDARELLLEAHSALCAALITEGIGEATDSPAQAEGAKGG